MPLSNFGILYGQAYSWGHNKQLISSCFLFSLFFCCITMILEIDNIMQLLARHEIERLSHYNFPYTVFTLNIWTPYHICVIKYLNKCI